MEESQLSIKTSGKGLNLDVQADFVIQILASCFCATAIKKS